MTWDGYCTDDPGRSHAPILCEIFESTKREASMRHNHFQGAEGFMRAYFSASETRTRFHKKMFFFSSAVLSSCGSALPTATYFPQRTKVLSTPGKTPRQTFITSPGLQLSGKGVSSRRESLIKRRWNRAGIITVLATKRSSST